MYYTEKSPHHVAKSFLIKKSKLLKQTDNLFLLLL